MQVIFRLLLATVLAMALVQLSICNNNNNNILVQAAKRRNDILITKNRLIVRDKKGSIVLDDSAPSKDCACDYMPMMLHSALMNPFGFGMYHAL